MLPPRASAPFRDLIEESFDEAAFLWRRWEAELSSLTRNLDEVWSWTEDRLHGALEGVCVGADGGLDLALEALASDLVDRATVGAAVLASSNDSRAGDALTAALDPASPERFQVVLRALELLGTAQTLRAAARKLDGQAPELAAGLCRLKSFRRSAPGKEVAVCVASESDAIRTAALRALRWGTDDAARRPVLEAMRSDDATIRLAALETGLRFGMAEARASLIKTAGALDQTAAAVLHLLAMLGSAADHEVVYSALRTEPLQERALWALGHVGTIRAAEACIAGMRHERLARAAGEAYCWITGANLERDNLAVQATVPDAPSFEDDDLDADLVPRAVDLWPTPDPQAVAAHWEARRGALDPNVRYVLGRAVSGPSLLEAIEHGPMIRRADLAFEVLVRTRGNYDVETRALTHRQRQMMTAGRAKVAGSAR